MVRYFTELDVSKTFSHYRLNMMQSHQLPLRHIACGFHKPFEKEKEYRNNKYWHD